MALTVQSLLLGQDLEGDPCLFRIRGCAPYGMTRVEELAPASKPASFGRTQLFAQRPWVINRSQKQREIPTMLVRIVGHTNGPCLDQDRSEHGRTREFEFSSIQPHGDRSAARESLRPASHGDRPSGRNR